jgi:hypothetical protein
MNIKRIPIALLITLFLVFSGILLWSLLPTKLIEQNYQVEFQAPIFKEAYCNPNLMFESFSIRIVYPETLMENKNDLLQITLQKNLNKKVESLVECRYQTEMSLKLTDAIIHPQNRLVQSLSENGKQSFQFKIEPKKNKIIKGDLWIYLNAQSLRTLESDQLPILVVPVSISTQSYFGISRNYVSLISAACLLFLFVTFIMWRHPNDIISPVND